MIIFFYGQDDYRIIDKLKSIKERFIKTTDPRAVSIEEIEAGNIEFSEIQEKILSSSLFTKKRLLIINNIFSNKKTNALGDLLLLLEKTKEQEGNVLCFVEKNFSSNKLNLKQKKLFNFLSQEKYSQEFKLLNNSQLYTYAQKLFSQQKIAKQALSLLIAKTGPNLWSLNNEANKLLALGKKEEISQEDIEELIIGQSENNIFTLCEAIATKDKELAFKLLNKEIANQTSFEYILSMLIRQAKILIEIKADHNRSSAKQMNIHPFVFSKNKKQVSSFSLDELLSLFDSLVNIEYSYKQGKIELEKALLALI